MRLFLLYAFIPVVVWTGLTRPFWGLLVYLSLNIIRPEMLFWGNDTGAILFRLSIGATLIGFFLKGNNVFTPLHYREIWLMFWVLLGVCASIFFAPILSESWSYGEWAWDYAEEILKLCLVCWLILGLVSKKEHLFRFEDVLLGVFSLLAVWGFQQHFAGNERLEGLGGKAFGDSNAIAAIGVLFFPIALHKILTTNNFLQKVFGLVSTFLLGLLIVFSESRGGLLGLCVAIVFLWWLTPKRRQLIVGLMIIFFITVPFIGQQYINRMETITASKEMRDFSAGARNVLWKVGLLIFEDNPIFGIGVLNFNRVKFSYQSQLREQVDEKLLNYTFTPYRVGHSTWVCQLLAEGGLFLTIPYLWLIFRFFWGALRVRRTQPPNLESFELHNLLFGMMAGISGLCISFSFIDGFFIIILPIQLVVGMQIIRAIERESEEWRPERLVSNTYGLENPAKQHV